MSTLLMFPPKVHFNDSNGDPLVGGKIYTYKAGEVTLIAKDTYTDKAQSATHTNPIILDSRGEAEVWLDGEYKFIIKDANDVEIYTVDDASTEGITSTLSEWLMTGDTPTYISATQFSVPTDLTATYHEGRRVKLTVTAGTVYGVISASAFTTLTTVTVVLDSGAIDSGLSVSDVGLLSADNQSYPIQQIQYGGYAYVADTGAADVYVAVMVPPLYDYKTGFACKVLMGNANATTTPTINVNGLGAKTIKRQTGSALVVNDIVANQTVDLVYDGTDFILMNKSVIDVHAHTNSTNGGLVAYPLYSDGVDGAYSSPGTGNIDGDVLNYTTYLVNSGHVMTVNTGKGIIIIADESITIEGELNADGIGGAGGAGGAIGDNPGAVGGSASEGVASGGGGGSGVSGTNNGGNSGTATFLYRSIVALGATTSADGSNGTTHPIDNPDQAFTARFGSGGGGGGSQATSYAGGDGGAGGGFIILIAPSITLEATATLSVNGVDGQDSNGVSDSGGGGGGGGGNILIVTNNYTDNGATFNFTGGASSLGFGTGSNGGSGGNGIKRVVEL